MVNVFFCLFYFFPVFLFLNADHVLLEWWRWFSSLLVYLHDLVKLQCTELSWLQYISLSCADTVLTSGQLVRVSLLSVIQMVMYNCNNTIQQSKWSTVWHKSFYNNVAHIAITSKSESILFHKFVNIWSNDEFFCMRATVDEYILNVCKPRTKKPKWWTPFEKYERKCKIA